jgi:hypothetical protein
MRPVLAATGFDGSVDKVNRKLAEPLRRKQLGDLSSRTLRVFDNLLDDHSGLKTLCQRSLPWLVRGDTTNLKKASAVGRHNHDKDVLQPAVVEDALVPVRVKHIPHNKRRECGTNLPASTSTSRLNELDKLQGRGDVGPSDSRCTWL